jgi:hypothetical protein
VAKKSGRGKGKGKGKADKDLDKKRRKAEAKAAKADKKQAKQQKAGKGSTSSTGAAVGEKSVAAVEQPTTTSQDAAGADHPTGGGSGVAAPTGPLEPVDQVALLKLALRDTEAKLVAAEHRLHQVQQQLDDERRALAEATVPSIDVEEAVIDAAVAETVAEAVLAAELTTVVAAPGEPLPADAAELAAAALEEVADSVDAALQDGSSATQGEAQRAARSDLTPPLPEQGPDSEPNEAWTLVHLRKEAERRGITGVSNLPKAALIERLRG